jgi:hypothetical protein
MTSQSVDKTILAREQRLGWARAIRFDIKNQSVARVRRACQMFLSESSHITLADHTWATETLEYLKKVEK